VKKIDVIGLEQLDIQGRSVFYEQTGALRDFIQGHLMELLILTLSSSLSERVSCINQLYIPNYEECVNAQYEGYKQEVGNKSSVTETFAKVTVYSKNPLFQSIPLNLITGKGLDIKESSINIS
jgi:glucose-6-phosphate 1-dehydrogenase